MRTQLLSIVTCVAIATPAFADAKKDLAALAGKWQPVSMEQGGRKTPAEQLKSISLTIEGDKFTVAVDDKLDQGTLKLGKQDKLKTMDIIGTEGPNKGRTYPAIYQLEGDSLKICYNLEGDQRPTEFKAASGKLLLIEYKKAKKS
jgi:uncharacterized protein (TIGR03067 family)